MSLPIINSHLEKYISLNGKTFTKKGEKYKISINSSIIKYPYKAIKFNGDLKNLDAKDEYIYTSLEDYETFDMFVVQLEKMLGKELVEV